MDTQTPLADLNNDLSSFRKVGGVTTVAATPSDVTFENIKKNIKLPCVRFQKLPEFKKVKGENRIALVGGGPSVTKYIDKIKEYRTIFACGSSHDFVQRHGIIPRYAGICDPDPVSINYFKHPHPETTYLLASGCDPKIFEHLKEYPIVMWHCHSDDYNDKLAQIEDHYEGVGGGCTIGLRAICLSVMLGYKNIDFFGFDSCLSDEQSYAYDLSTQEEKDSQGEVYKLKIGMDWNGPSEKTYSCLGYHLAQAEHFRKFLEAYPGLINPTFYGEGLLPDLVRMIYQETLKADLASGLKKQQEQVTQ